VSSINWPPWVYTMLAWYHWAMLYEQWLWYGAGGVAVLLGVGIGILRRRSHHPDGTHGSARLATPEEVLALPAFQGNGIVVGKLQGHLLQVDVQENALVVGPKGVGKSTSVAMPTIARWHGGLIVIDVSGELVQTTASWRHGRDLGAVDVLDFLSPCGAHYNPNDGIRWKTLFEIMDAQRIASHLTDPDTGVHRSEVGDFYRPLIAALYTCGMLYGHYRGTHHDSIGGLLAFVKGCTRETLQAMTRFTHQDLQHRYIQDTAGMLAGQTNDILKGILIGGYRWLSIWEDPLLDAVTHDTTIDLDAFQQQPRPATLYICISVEDLQGRLRAPFRLLTDQLSFRLCSLTFVHDLLWLNDDMPAMGNLPWLRLGPAQRRKYGHRFLNFCQDFGQIEDTFGRNFGGLLSNSTTKVFFRPADSHSSAALERALHEQTAVDHLATVSRRGWDVPTRSRREQAHAMPVLSADALERLADDEVLVWLSGHRPAVVTQARWYEPL
jgi:type IV secretion system protein VirD4